MALMTTMKAIRSDGTARMPKLCPEKTHTTATQTWNPKIQQEETSAMSEAS